MLTPRKFDDFPKQYGWLTESVSRRQALTTNTQFACNRAYPSCPSPEQNARKFSYDALTSWMSTTWFPAAVPLGGMGKTWELVHIWNSQLQQQNLHILHINFVLTYLANSYSCMFYANWLGEYNAIFVIMHIQAYYEYVCIWNAYLCTFWKWILAYIWFCIFLHIFCT